MTDDNNNQIVDNTKPKVSDDTTKLSPEEKENADTEIKTREVKKLEEKEHYELDYFSKEDLLKEKEELEKKLVDLKENVEKLQKENSDSKKKFMHLQAEFENAQKRWDKNRQNMRIEYIASVLKSFLPLYDSFKKALDSHDDKENNVISSFFKQFMNIFKSYGAEPIEVNKNDKFDYSIHEALTSIEKEDIPENSILEVVQDGFKYGKEVIRYAKVVTSRKPKPPKPESEPEIEEEKEKEVEETVSEGIESKEETNKQEEIKEKKTKDKKHKKDKYEK